MKRKDYIPACGADLKVFFDRLVHVTTENREKWGIPEEVLTVLLSFHTCWNSAYAKSCDKENRSHAEVFEKDQAKKDAVQAIRQFVSEYLAYSSKVTDTEREALGIRTRFARQLRSRAQVPVSTPLAEIDMSNRLQHTVRYVDSLSGKRAKPEKVVYCEIWHKVGGEAPKSFSDLSFLGFSTCSSFLAKYDGELAGDTIYYWLRWINTRGEAGLWSRTVAATLGQ